jgi:hypothetical protein
MIPDSLLLAFPGCVLEVCIFTWAVKGCAQALPAEGSSASVEP